MRYLIEILFTVLLFTALIEGQREGDLCVVAETIQPGVCRHILKCSVALEAAFNGKPYQVCASPENRLIVCCPWVPEQETGLQARFRANTTTPREGDNCTMVDTGRAGVCSQFANCQTAVKAASKGIFPQVCALEGTNQIICCPLVTVAEGDHCSVAKTGRAGKCLRISKCPFAVEAALKGITPQICALDGPIPIVCCEGVVEGSHCPLNDTMPGVCRRFANCPRAMKAAVRGVVPQKCDLTDNMSELVCCAESACSPLPKGPVTQLPYGFKAADYCMELAEKIYPCQETSSGWTRGNMCPLPDPNTGYHKTPMTTTAEAPYYGRIGQGKQGEISWWEYPVSLVSDRWVVTTAYAVKRIGPNNVNFIGLGGTFTPRYNPDETYGVTKPYIYPLYDINYSTEYNNIALIQLDRSVKFTSRILPVCLHTGTPLPDSGFLYTVRDGSAEIKTTMRRVSENECYRVFPVGDSHHPAGVKHDLEICGRPVNTAAVCPSWFNGGMLTLPNSRLACTHLLVGVVSWRSACTFAFTRISTFIPWIVGIVWPDSSVVV